MFRNPLTAIALFVLCATGASCVATSVSTDRVSADPDIELVAVDPPMVEPEVVGEEPEPPAVSEPIEIPSGDSAVVYLLVDASSSSSRADGLVPTARPLAVLSAPVTDPVATAIAFLLAGPTTAERQASPALSSAIPEGTRLLGVTLEDAVATIDLSTEFESPSGTYAEAARIEQVVFTLTRFDTIDSVRFSIEGQPVEFFGGHGIDLREPVDRSSLLTAQPPIMIESPPRWGVTSNPISVSGTAGSGVAMVHLSLADEDGAVLWEGSVEINDCGPLCRSTWATDIPYAVDEDQLATLTAWTIGTDAGPEQLREHAIFLRAES
jgi:hypothetical protein